ncbi:hypothetical protein BCR41DRAFT_393410 [Lobosporangium transversale]|uniref:Uncharacterized protein n=1 Tax=Lobosporangium transversale TaxID=64571 RepID=A0A1Y2GWX4_9FUNG|nr:hypothetical protein BCR41DRAFT_393408 [Lobosporangium transversale]XP_021884565.1 hypothetical protein BCR41DRAFT_393410 [Lobosporangium transversale]ORZ26800.1 hypothetical protein BCR41DRAFT_393408 [Lobosporangium transversale]ORZ26802.1 hypothetical protein BCR41DRAFT_393410 [Lobosporangium transversale]|eukprot:XP_021884563.1 hypothetical protein BCR41DRAFT_393408 [Lobosporangium transversale]
MSQFDSVLAKTRQDKTRTALVQSSAALRESPGSSPVWREADSPGRTMRRWSGCAPSGPEALGRSINTRHLRAQPAPSSACSVLQADDGTRWTEASTLERANTPL